MSRSQRLSRSALDFAVAAVFFWIGCVLMGPWVGGPAPAPDQGWLAPTYALVLILAFGYLDLNQEQLSLLNLGELTEVLRGLALTATVFVMLLFLFESAGPTAPIFLGILLASAAVLVERRLVSSFMKRLQLAGKLGRRVLLYGCGATGERLMKKIFQAPDLGCTVVGFLDDYAAPGSTIGCRVSQASEDRVEVPVLGRLQDLEKVVRERVVDEVLVTIPSPAPWKLAQLLETAREYRLRIGIVPLLSVFRADQLRAENMGGIPILRPYAFDRHRPYLVVKRFLDILLSLVLLILLLPAWMATWLIIRLDSPGPALFRQERVGLGGRVFQMYKFRTMYRDVARYARAPSNSDDARITRIGRWVRTAGFDETPQLLNVLKGDMSLVGPRPEMPFIVEEYSEFDRQRLLVLPGITGLWQLSADRSSEIHENIEYDLYYIQNRSVLLDLAILVETVFFGASVLLHKALQIDRLLLVSDRLGRGREPASPSGSPDRKGAFVLAALDQRINGELPDRWRRVLPVLATLSSQVPLKVLVAERNVELLDDLLRDVYVGDGVAAGKAPEYVPHFDRADLGRITREATLVVTDLKTVAEWADDDVEVLLVDSGKRTRRRNGGTEESSLARTVRLQLDAALERALEAPPDMALQS